MSDDDRPCLFRKAEIEKMAEWRFVHQHNPDALRFTRPLGDMAGCEDIGVHLVRVPPGSASTCFHSHEVDEEFVYVISGRAVAEIGEETHEVGPGDVMVFAKNSPAHMMTNRSEDDFVFLVGGSRPDFDVCNYPRDGIRQFRVNGAREYTSPDQLKKVTATSEKVDPPST